MAYVQHSDLIFSFLDVILSVKCKRKENKTKTYQKHLVYFVLKMMMDLIKKEKNDLEKD